MRTVETRNLKELLYIVRLARERVESQHYKKKVAPMSIMRRYFEYALYGRRPSDEVMREDVRLMEEAEEQMEALKKEIDKLYEVEGLVRKVLEKLPSLNSNVILTCDKNGEISKNISLSW